MAGVVTLFIRWASRSASVRLFGKRRAGGGHQSSETYTQSEPTLRALLLAEGASKLTLVERREVSAEENKAVVLRWIEAYNERDMQTEADARALATWPTSLLPQAPWTRRPGRSSSPPSLRRFPTFGSRWRTSCLRGT